MQCFCIKTSMKPSLIFCIECPPQSLLHIFMKMHNIHILATKPIIWKIHNSAGNDRYNLFHAIHSSIYYIIAKVAFFSTSMSQISVSVQLYKCICLYIGYRVGRSFFAIKPHDKVYLSFYNSSVLSFSRSLFLSFYHSVFLSFYISVFLSF